MRACEALWNLPPHPVVWYRFCIASLRTDCDAANIVSATGSFSSCPPAGRRIARFQKCDDFMPARKKSSPRRRKPPADEIELAEDLDYAAKGGWRNVLQKVVDTLEAFRYQQQAEVLTEILEAGYRDLAAAERFG